MELRTRSDRRVLELMLIIVMIGMTTLFYLMSHHGLVALNVFFLPVLVCAYFLGRTTAGSLAFFGILAVTIVAAFTGASFAGYQGPVMIGLALVIWAASLGLAAILTGTLCDERAQANADLHRAYVGVVEVLSKYLQGVNPATQRTIRIAELSQQVAQTLGMSPRDVDHVRVAALLRELESVEITTQLANQAVSALAQGTGRPSKHTILGTDLVHSLGAVLEGALPLIVSQSDDLRECLSATGERPNEVPVGARIISLVRAFDTLRRGTELQPPLSAAEAIGELEAAVSPNDRKMVSALSKAVEDVGNGQMPSAPRLPRVPCAALGAQHE